MSFFYAGKLSSLCADCGTTIRNTHRDKHLTRPFHVAAVAAQAYRHRDDTPHSATGPIGCYVCAELRRLARKPENSKRRKMEAPE